MKPPKKPKQPKIPKPPRTVGDNLKAGAKRSFAKVLRSNFGVLGDSIAKKVVPQSSYRKRSREEPPKGSDKKIKAKKTSGIEESTKQVVAAIDAVSANASRGFEQATRQAQTMGVDITNSMGELTSALSRLFQRSSSMMEQPAQQQQAQATPVKSSPKKDEDSSSIFDGLGGKTIGVIGTILMGITALKKSAENKEHLKDLRRQENIQKYGKEKGEILSDAQNQNTFERIGSVFHQLFGTSDSKVEKPVIKKFKFTAEKIKFDVSNVITFKRRTPLPTSGAIGPTGDTPTGKNGGGASGIPPDTSGGGIDPNAVPEPGPTGNAGGVRSRAGNSRSTPQGTPPVNAEQNPNTNSDGLFNPISATSLSGQPGSDSASRGGGQHQGVDMMAKRGSPVYAAKSGVITKIGTDNFGQPTLTIKHDDGTYSRYLHMGENFNKVGERVNGGKQVGTSGSANGVEHLHFERWTQPPNNEGVGLINPRTEYGWDRKDANGKKPAIVGGNNIIPPKEQAPPSKLEAQKIYNEDMDVKASTNPFLSKKSDAKPITSEPDVKPNKPEENSRDATPLGGMSTNDRGLSDLSYEGTDTPSWGFDSWKGIGFKGRKRSKSIDDRRWNDMSIREGIQKIDPIDKTETMKPSPLSGALGVPDLLKIQRNNTISQGAIMSIDDEIDQYEALKPHIMSPPKETSPNDYKGGSNPATAKYQDTKSDDDLYHGPKMVKAPNQSYSDYLGTGNGVE